MQSEIYIKSKTEYKQEGVTCLPSYQALQEQLEMLDKLSDSNERHHDVGEHRA